MDNNLENQMNEAVNTAEEAVETAAEVVKEEAVETVEEATEAVSEVSEAAEEATEEVAEAAEEVTEEVTEEATETVEEAVAVTPEVPKAVVTKEAPKGKAKQAPVIKKKSSFNPTTLIAIIVCAVVILACVAFVLYKKGVFYVPQKSVYTIAAHETLEVEEPEVSDSTIDSYVSTFQTAYNVTEQITTGTVEDGDKLHIQYVGTIDGEAFSGGSTDESGADLTIGSGSYIDGFESGLIGKKIGDTVVLDLTFPEDYSSTDLAGKDCQFTVTIEYKSVTTTPDFTDEFVKTNSYEYLEKNYGEGAQLDTTADFRQYIYDKVYNATLESNIQTSIFNLIDMTQYDETKYALIHDGAINQLTTYGSYYGYDADTFAQYYGYESAEAYATQEAEYEIKLATVYADLAKEFGFTHTDADVDVAIQEYMEENGYSEAYTLESFKETSGEGWVYMFENYQMNADKVNEVMKERVVLVPAATEE